MKNHVSSSCVLNEASKLGMSPGSGPNMWLSVSAVWACMA